MPVSITASSLICSDVLDVNLSYLPISATDTHLWLFVHQYLGSVLDGVFPSCKSNTSFIGRILYFLLPNISTNLDLTISDCSLIIACSSEIFLSITSISSTTFC